MYSKNTQHKAPKGSVQIKVSNGRLQIVFSHAGKRHYLSLGLPDNKLNRKAAEAKGKLIEADIAYERFDGTLAKYKPQSALSTVTPEITPVSTQPSLAELWTKFVEYKHPQCSPSTMNFSYRTFTNYLNDLPTHDLSDASEIRDHILRTIPIESAKRFIVRLSACCTWAMKSGLIEANPFVGMAAEIKPPKSSRNGGMSENFPFSREEKSQILEAFRTDSTCSKFARVKHSYYYPYVFFLFNTGCRPSEAIALQWKHISPDVRFIRFEQAIVISESGKVCKEGLKTQDHRKFPCNNKMQEFLRGIKPNDANREDLVFPSPTGKWIDITNFRNKIWLPILTKLGIEYRKPYQARHTFITLALEHGLDAKDVARLVGNSPEVIYRHYAGNKRELFVPEF